MRLLWPATQQATAGANSSYIIFVMNLSKLFHSNIFICMALVSTGLGSMKHFSKLIESQLASMFREIRCCCRII